MARELDCPQGTHRATCSPGLSLLSASPSGTRDLPQQETEAAVAPATVPEEAPGPSGQGAGPRPAQVTHVAPGVLVWSAPPVMCSACSPLLEAPAYESGPGGARSHGLQLRDVIPRRNRGGPRALGSAVATHSSLMARASVGQHDTPSPGAQAAGPPVGGPCVQPRFWPRGRRVVGRPPGSPPVPTEGSPDLDHLVTRWCPQVMPSDCRLPLG